MMSKDSPAVKKQKTSHRTISDSSDEEAQKGLNETYSLARAFEESEEAIEDLAEDFGVKKSDVEKSFLLHCLGRMLIYSPRLEEKYRMQKDRLLYTQNSEDNPYLLSQEGTINSEALDIKVRNLEELLVLGRLMRRSQVRSYKDIVNYDEVIETRAEIKLSSNNNRTSATVIEDLVVSYNGLSRGKQKKGEKYKPSIDMVQLGLPNDKGDYSSAYKGNQYNRGRSAVTQVARAAKSVIDNGDLKEGDNQELERAMVTIDNLKEKISEKFPDINNDSFIADNIRKVCRGEPLFELSTSQDLQNQIYSLTYLLFKTEVYRSPAALVSHTQMLDLIIHGEMTFEDAFVKNEMPMSAKNVIKAARSLEGDYDEAFYQFSNPYRYAPGYEDKLGKKNLIKREAKLMDKWMIFRFGEERYDDMQRSGFKENLPQICEEIYGSLQNFGMNLHSHTLHRMILPPLESKEASDIIPSTSLRSSPVTASHLVSDSKDSKQGSVAL